MTTAKSPHVSDPTLAPFLQPRFDPADYLNTTLPSLSLSSVSARPLKSGNTVPLADLSSQTSDLLSQLNAHTTRLSAILTQLTDDILRSGARLAYEVEVLRGETTGLTETLSDTLEEDVRKFVPGGISSKPSEDDVEEEGEEDATNPSSDSIKPAQQQQQEPTTPPHITSLRTLTLVRTRLDSVIKTFGEAMHWTLPPSEISLTSSLISVSGPEPGADHASREQKGKEFAAALRSEIADLLAGRNGGADGDVQEEGVETARVRVQALRDLAGVWRGTAEEKARVKFVEGLAKMVEERQREVEREREREKRSTNRVAARNGVNGSGSSTGSSAPKSASQTSALPLAQPQQSRGGGFLDNLQRIRENYIQ